VEAEAELAAELYEEAEARASCERVTKSCWAAEVLPLCRSVPSCLKSVRNCWELVRSVSSWERFPEIAEVDIDESPASFCAHYSSRNKPYGFFIGSFRDFFSSNAKITHIICISTTPKEIQERGEAGRSQWWVGLPFGALGKTDADGDAYL